MRKHNSKFLLKRGGSHASKGPSPEMIHRMTNDKAYQSAALIMALGEMTYRRGV